MRKPVMRWGTLLGLSLMAFQGVPAVAEPIEDLSVGGQLRHRLESRNNFTLNDSSYEDDAVNLLRARIHADWHPADTFRLFVEGQDAESFSQSSLNKTTRFVNRFDLRQLHVTLRAPEEAPALSATVGRQVLAFGDQRFVGGFDWSNVARVFDAGKVTYTPSDTFRIEAFYGQVVPVQRSNPDSANHNDHFFGAYTTCRPWNDHLIDTFAFVRNNETQFSGERAGDRGRLEEYTIWNRFKGASSGFDYGLEWAHQFGERADNDIGAWAFHAEGGYTFADTCWAPRVSAEFNHGSGDDDPTDGDVGNFDNLYPTNHLHYGEIDFASLRNINHVKVGVDAKPHARVKVNASGHFFWLDTNRSAWFNAGQAAIRPATPGAGETVGQELDLLVKWKATDRVDVSAGYSHFFAGDFVDDTGTDDDADFVYVQTTVNL